MIFTLFLATFGKRYFFTQILQDRDQVQDVLTSTTHILPEVQPGSLDEILEKFFGSFNMNIKVIYDLLWPTHKWLCEFLVDKVIFR